MRYTHIGLDDQAKALESLPCLHIVCNSVGANGQDVADADSESQETEPAEESENPCKSRGYDAECQVSAPLGTECQKVEAAGIEPASRDRSTPASTCVVGTLYIRHQTPLPTGLPDN